MAREPADKSQIDLENMTHGLGFATNKSIRYHSKKRRYYNWVHRIFQAAILVGGTSTVSALWATNQTVALNMSAFLTVAGLIDFIFDFTGSARLHDDLYRRLVILAGKYPANKALRQTQIDRFWEERFAIGADEPTLSKVLDVMCHNEELIARGYDKGQLVKTYFYQRYFCMAFDLPPTDFIQEQ